MNVNKNIHTAKSNIYNNKQTKRKINYRKLETKWQRKKILFNTWKTV